MTRLIRKLTREDVRYEKALSLRLDVLVHPFGIDPAEATKDDASAHHFALMEGDACVAALLLCPGEEGVLQMRQVAVIPKRQRQGLGQQLVRGAEEWVQATGYQLVWANIRQSAEAFYESLGYSLSDDTYELVGLPHRRAEKRFPFPRE